MPEQHDIGGEKIDLLLLEQRKLLELIATGVPLDECLSAVCSAVPRLSPHTRASILLADEKCLTFPRSISPDLLPSFGEGLKNAPINDLAIGTCGEALFHGRQVICDNIAAEGKWSKPWRDLCIAHGVMACVSEPIVAPDGRQFGSFMLCFDEPRGPTEWEQRMVKFGTYVASIALTRDRAIQELQRSEKRYRTLFESIDAGFFLLEMTGPDDTGRPGFRLLEANPVFARISRLQPKTGEEIRDLAPDLGDDWISIFERVALTGESVRTEMAAGDRWLEAYAYRVDKPQDRRVAVLFDDITGRKQSAMNMEFLSSVSHEMTQPEKVDELMNGVVASIGGFMKLCLCAVAHIDGKGGRARALYRWQQDDRDSANRADTLMSYLAKDFQKKAKDQQVLAVSDVEGYPGIDSGKYVALGTRSFVFAPGSPGNHRRFALGVCHSEVHDWKVEEIDLVHRLARRIWTRLESARTEEAMHESERKLRQIFEGAKDYAIFAVDLQGHFTSWSPGAERLFGFEEEEILGQHFEMLFTVTDREKGAPKAEMECARRAGVAEDDRWHQRKDGSEFFASGLTQPIFDRSGVHTGYTKICRDCTASHQAREWLQRELVDSQRLQELSARLVAEGDFPAMMDEIMQGAVVITQSDLGTVHLMEGVSGLRLLTATGFAQGCLNEFQEVLPDDETSCSIAIRAGQRVVIPDMDASDCDPEKTPHADVARAGVKAGQWTPLISRSGRLLGVMATYWCQPHEPDERELRLLDLLTRQAADLIERHQSEAALRESEHKLRELSQSLELRVEQRTAELKEQTARLQNLAAELSSAEQRERKRVAALLHDGLQQLLVAAGLQLEMAASSSNGENRNSINRAAKWIKEARSAARDLTCQLRPPALYEDGLVAALHWLASEMEERHHLKVTISGGEPAMPISDDIKALLFECVRELLFNVAKYARVNRAALAVREEVGRLHVVVSDHGVGFDADTVGTSRQNGAFGLFSIRERLTALSGEMVMISSPGKGTRIELYIPHAPSAGTPVVRREKQLAAEPAVRCATELHALDPRIKVLVVDDHPMIREGIATVLGSDYRVSVCGQASDGLAAVEAVQHLTPDVVLMDVNMPRMNGIEATREISRRWPEIRIIGLSVQDDPTTAKSMLDAGAAEFISKSSALELMIAAILHQVPYADSELAQVAQSEI